MPLLFSYGTLQEEAVQIATFGRRLAGIRDELPGFEASRVPIDRPETAAALGRTHHANVRFTGETASCVPGTVFDITDDELAAADRYETAESYSRISVSLASGRRAWVYLHVSGVAAPGLTPSVTYADAHRGIEWLTRVLGFRVVSEYASPAGGVAFAELVWRTGVVFVSDRPSGDNPWSSARASSIAIVAESATAVDAIFDRAVAAGADIVRAVRDVHTPAFPEGSRQFDVRDPEGNLWTVGTFQPRVAVRW
jgi:uncharacterized glyoxalase superfamily protein PhnB